LGAWKRGGLGMNEFFLSLNKSEILSEEINVFQKQKKVFPLNSTNSLGDCKISVELDNVQKAFLTMRNNL
jgi:hypothetical protein